MNTTPVSSFDAPDHHLSTLDLDDVFTSAADGDFHCHFSADVYREEFVAKTNSPGTDAFRQAAATKLSISPDTSELALNFQRSRLSSRSENSGSMDNGPSEQFSQMSLNYEENLVQRSVGSLAVRDFEEGNKRLGPCVTSQNSGENHRDSSTQERETWNKTENATKISCFDLTEKKSSQMLKPSAISTETALESFSPPTATLAIATSLIKLPRSHGHRRLRSTGPSILERVVNKTRPTFLPPKPRKEDDRHMAEWQVMMKQSRHTVEKKRTALHERRIQREQGIEQSRSTWEKEILPDWSVVYKQPHLRKLWWRGIPTKLRAPLWECAVGNALALSKDHYRTCLSRAKRDLQSEIFPQSSLSQIEDDISTTLPALNIFHHQAGPLYSELKDMLCAWVVSRSDEGLSYTFGAAKVAAMFLITMPVQQAFIVMRNLLERHCMRSFFGGQGSLDDVEAYYRIFDTLLADSLPKIYFNFKQHQISPSAYLIDWILPLFLDHLPFEACARIWDVLVLEGDSFIYRTALAMLAVLESRLYFLDKRELFQLLKGESKSAINIARREGMALNGGKYEIYGVDEETLWDRIHAMEEWWKESTWVRLLERELPDL